MNTRWQAAAPQLSLLRPEPFLPMPRGPHQYLAALQNRSGELDALSHASGSTWDRMKPLLHFVGPKTVSSGINSSRVDGWVKRVAAAVGAHPCFLDLMRLKANQGLTDLPRESVLASIYAASRRRGLRFVPVLPLPAEPRHLNLVSEAAHVDGRGVCIRYCVSSAITVTGDTLARLLSNALEALSIPCSEVDLVVDLGFLDPGSAVDIPWLCRVFSDASKVGAWRSQALLGSSIPATMSCIPEGQFGGIPRKEWQIWSQVCARLPNAPSTFGDYGIRHPRPPRDGGRGMRANIRYTKAGETVVVRGWGVFEIEGKRQYRDLCARLAAQTYFATPDYSWGDQVIAECADGEREPGSQRMWRGAGTSHHIRFVVDELAAPSRYMLA